MLASLVVDRPFDLVNAADACVQCGLCLPHCPTYRLDAREDRSPRGRIALARALGRGQLSAADDGLLASWDSCLGCRQCEAVCPAKVDFAGILEHTRQRTRGERVGGSQRLLEWWAAHPRWRRWLLDFAGLASRLAPGRRRRLGWPDATPPRPGRYPPPGQRRGRLHLATGCYAQHLDAGVHRAAITLLTALGWEVELAAASACCGALHRHAGATTTAAQLGKALADQVGNDCTTVIMAASGCVETAAKAVAPRPLYELGRFLLDDSRWRQLRFAALTQTIAVQTPCSQRSVLRQADLDRRLLAPLQPATWIELPPQCCGAAGSHMLTAPKHAAALAEPTVQCILKQQPQLLLSSNVGCRVHLQRQLADRAPTLRFLHPVELLAEHLR